MFMLEEKYKIIHKNNNELIIEAIKYMMNLFKISEEQLLLKAKYYVKELLYEVRKNNNEVTVLRRQCRNKEQDLIALEHSYVKGKNYDLVTPGKNNGFKPNNEELRLLNIEELKEEIRNTIADILLIEKSLEEKNKLIRSFINLIPQKQYIAVLEFTYFNCITNKEIAIELNYSSEYVRQAKIRSFALLSELIKCQLKK